MVGLRLGQRSRLELKIKLDTRPRFKRAVDCDITELESVLDRYAPPSEQKGFWPHNPIAPDPVETYQACYKTLLKIDPYTGLTTAHYIRKALANKEENSFEIFQLVKTLAEYLPKNEDIK